MEEKMHTHFRKKPVVIEAWRWNGDTDFTKAPDWLAAIVPHWSPKAIGIPTLEGLMQASPGDWIIRGVKGEVYPCKPDIFAATYEPASVNSHASNLERSAALTDALSDLLNCVDGQHDEEWLERSKTKARAALKPGA